MKDCNCTYSWTQEVEGNPTRVEGLPGVVRSDIFQKSHKDKTHSMLWVEDTATGELREVFAFTVKVIR